MIEKRSQCGEYVHHEHISLPFDKYSAIAYNASMDTSKYANFRAFKEDLAVLKEIAAIRRESMVQTFKHLVQQEYERVRQEGGKRYAAGKKDQA